MSAAAALMAWTAAAALALDVDVSTYRRDGASASLAVRVYEERRRPGAAETPLIGTTVTLLPRSLALLGRLDGLKASARDSTAGYRDAARGMRRVRDDFMQALRDAEAGALVRAASVDGDGRVVFDAVPGGDWVLFGWRSIPVEKRGRGGGYRAISVWVRELTIAAGTSEMIELTDRNLWFSGVEQDDRAGAGR